MIGIPSSQSNGFTESLPESADDLQAVVRAERQELKRSLDELGTAVRDKVDVRSRLLEHPLMAVGAALSAGVVLGILSNKAMQSGGSGRTPAASSPTRAASPQPKSGIGFGHMASTVAALVGQRLANVAEEAVRNVLARRPV